MLKRCLVLITFLIPVHGLIAATTASAQIRESERERLAEEIRSAAEQFDRDELPSVDLARQRVRESIEAVRDYFERRATPENFAAWMDYLDLEPLVDALQSDEQLEEQARQAIAVRERLIGTWEGLELRVLRQLRQDVGQLVDAVRFRDPDMAPRLVERQIEVLAERVAQLDPVPTADQLATISRIMESLEGSGQASNQLVVLRNAFSIPNLRLLVGEQAVAQAVSRPVNQSERVADCILGTRLSGCAYLMGAISVDLLPSTRTAQMVLTLNGRFTSRNTGYNGPVRLKTTGKGAVTASRTVTVDDAGIRLGATTTQATLDTNIDAIQHPLRIVRHIARNRAAKQKSQAERIALNRVRRRIGSRFAEEVDESIGAAPPPVLSKAETWLQRLDIPDPATSWMSTRDAIAVQASVQRSSQLGAAVPAPSVEPLFAAVQVHETVVDNALGSFLGGRTFTQADLDQLIDSVRPDERGTPETGESAESDGSDGEAFEIDFARLRPLIFEARGGTLRLGIRGTRFEQGRRKLERALEITATYRPVPTSNGNVELVRNGEVDVDFPGRARLSVSQAAMRSTIERRFEDLFPMRLLNKAWTVPMTSQLETLRGTTFQPQQVKAEDGWLTIAVR